MAKARATREPWLPSPGQFCEWCQISAEDLGLPSVEKAFNEARVELHKHPTYRKWSHQAVYFAASAVGVFDLKSLEDKSSSYREVKARFAAEYASIVEKVKAGEIMEVPEGRRIEKQKPAFDTPAAITAGATAISNILGAFDE